MLVVLVARGQVLAHLLFVLLSFDTTRLVEDMNASNHIRCIVVAISAQETSIGLGQSIV